MSWFTNNMLVMYHDEVEAVPSETVTVGFENGSETVLYDDPIAVLAAVAGDMRFDIDGKYVKLSVFENHGTHVLGQVIEDGRRIHFYRRLLAQRALAAYTVEYRCARILELAVAQKKIARDALAQVLMPALPAAQLGVASAVMTAEYFLRTAKPEHFERLLEIKCGESFYITTDMITHNNSAFLNTVTFCGKHDELDPGVYALTRHTATVVGLVHLLADLRVSRKPHEHAW